MSRKILIVDDEPHMLRVTELSLKRGGFDVLLARNGRDAVALAIRERPDLIVLDVVMPDVDGFTVLEELKASPEAGAIPVIMLTSRGQAVAREKAASSGAALYITKPFSPSQLLAEARRVMGVES
jgi:DNA-binding response OmpR family regulator